MRAIGHVDPGQVLGLRVPTNPWVHMSLNVQYDIKGVQLPVAERTPVPFTGKASIAGRDFGTEPTSPANLHACESIQSSTGASGDTLLPSPLPTITQADLSACGTGATPSATPTPTPAPMPSPTPTPKPKPTPTPKPTVLDCATLRIAAKGRTLGSSAYRSNVEAQVRAGCLVYMSSPASLYLVDVASGTVVKVGDYGQVGDMFDIALAPDGTMYGLASSGSELVSIDRWTGATTDIGSTNATLNGLTVMPNGKMYGSGGTDLFAVNPHSGAATKIGSTGYASSGDLTSDGSGSLLLASNVLVRVDPTSGSAHAIGTADFSDVFGLTMTATGLYGGTSGGQLLSIDPLTGQYRVVATGLPAWYGMG